MNSFKWQILQMPRGFSSLELGACGGDYNSKIMLHPVAASEFSDEMLFALAEHGAQNGILPEAAAEPLQALRNSVNSETCYVMQGVIIGLLILHH